MVIDTFRTAAVSPKYADKSRVTMHGFALSTAMLDSGGCTAGAVTRRALSRVSGNTSVDWSTEPGPRREPGRDGDKQYDGDQDERSCRRQPVPLVVRAGCVGED